MPDTAHTIEPASSGRAKCRGCASPIPKGELRFGERVPNAFADDKDMTLWFHLSCAAFKRPESFLEALAATSEEVEARARLTEQAEQGIEHRRLPRVDGAERAPSGRAACRSCHDKIEKGSWRLRLVYFEEDRFNPSGFVHARCVQEYLGTTELLERVRCFSSALDAAELSDLEQTLAG